MKKQKRLSRVSMQAFLLTAVMVVLSCLLIFAVNYTLSYRDMIDSLQERARGIYQYLEQNLNVESFSSLNIPDDMRDEEYRELKKMFENIKSVTGVRYLYTAKQADTGEYIYLVDGLPSENEDFRRVGDLIEPEIIPDIERAYQNEIVLPEEIKDTSWGNIFISYFPIHSDAGNGEVIGVVGIEFDAEHQYRTFRWLGMATPAIIAVCCVVAGIIAALLFKRISNPAYRDMANTDLLTGLGNRNAFNVALNNLEALPDKTGIGIVIIDLDDLKQVNDSLGHPAGDEYIRAGGSLAQRFIKPPDVLYRGRRRRICRLCPRKQRGRARGGREGRRRSGRGFLRPERAAGPPVGWMRGVPAGGGCRHCGCHRARRRGDVPYEESEKRTRQRRKTAAGPVKTGIGLQQKRLSPRGKAFYADRLFPAGQLAGQRFRKQCDAADD